MWMCVRECVTVCVHFQVHNSCKEQMEKVCPLGQCRVSIIPPTALNSIDSDGETPRTLSHTHTGPFVLSIVCTAGSKFRSPLSIPLRVNVLNIQGVALLLASFSRCA